MQNGLTTSLKLFRFVFDPRLHDLQRLVLDLFHTAFKFFTED